MLPPAGPARHVRPRKTAAATVLIVDDDPMIRSLLAEYSRELGVRTCEADDGAAALAWARHARPDLVLLDVAMPKMDGKQFLAHIKADPELKTVPVIVVSGAGETEVAVQCIELGAEDFVSKPFRPPLLLARMRSCLERARLHAHERLKVLDHAKDDFLRLISHELRTPVTGVVGAAEALTGPTLDAAGRALALDVLRSSVERLQAIVEHALLLTSVRVAGEDSPLAVQPLDPMVRTAVARAAAAAARRGITLRMDPVADDLVLCERGLLVDALAALLECAVKFSADGETVGIARRREGDTVQVLITATGQGIPASVLERFFDVLSVREPLTHGGDLGLAPPVAAELLHALGGAVAARSQPGGVAFEVTLRAAEPAAAGVR